MINLKQSGLFQNDQNNLKKHESQKKKDTILISHILLYNVYMFICFIMFYYKDPWFYQDFKIEKLCLINLNSFHARGILNLSCKVLSNKERNAFTTLMVFSFMPE